MIKTIRTGIVFPFSPRKVFRVYDASYSEKLVHKELAQYRIRNDREFFILSYSKACENSGHNVLDDFAEVSKTVEAGATHKSTKDYELSRYACYFSKCRLYGTLWRS